MTRRFFPLLPMLTALVTVSLLLPAVAPASDMVRDEIGELTKRYDAGDLPGAIDSARLIETWLLEKQAEGLSDVFGEVPGWTKTGGEAQAVGMALMGGGITASENYENGDARMSAELVANSPMLGMISGMMGNSFMAMSSGKKIIKIDGRKAMVEQSGDNWEIMLPYEGQVLLTVRGPDKDAAIVCIERIDWDTVKKMVEAQ